MGALLSSRNSVSEASWLAVAAEQADRWSGQAQHFRSAYICLSIRALIVESLLCHVRAVCLREYSEVKLCPLQIRRLVSVPYARHRPTAARTAAHRHLDCLDRTANGCLLLFRERKDHCVSRSQCGLTQGAFTPKLRS